MWQDSSNPYGASSSQNAYYAQAQPLVPEQPLQFYSPGVVDPNAFYPGSRPSLDGNVAAQGTISQQGMAPGYGGNIQASGGWWTAFGTGGFEGEPPLLEGRITGPLLALFLANRRIVERAGHQLLTYTRKIVDSS